MTVTAKPKITTQRLSIVPSCRSGTMPPNTDEANASFDISRKYPPIFSFLALFFSFSSTVTIIVCFLSVTYFTFISSTSKMRAAYGGMACPAPCSP